MVAVAVVHKAHAEGVNHHAQPLGAGPENHCPQKLLCAVQLLLLCTGSAVGRSEVGNEGVWGYSVLGPKLPLGLAWENAIDHARESF